MGDFNPFSIDAQLASVIEKLKSQDRKSAEMHAENRRVLDEILKQTKETNGRVTTLEIQAEGHRRYIRGAVAVICFVATSTIAFLHYLFPR